MAARFPHESRFRSTLRVAGVADAAFNVRNVARELQVDLDNRFDYRPSLFEPLGSLMVGRRVLVEHESRSPSERSSRRMLIKLLVALNSSDRTSGERPPLLVVLCRRGLGALPRLIRLTSTGIPGVLRGADGDLRGVYVVDGAHLPVAPGYAGLRFIPRPDRDDTDYLAELLGDTTIPMVLRQQVEVATMNHEIPAAEGERLTAWERTYREGMAAGVARGRRAAMLALAERLLGRNVAAEFGRLANVDEIEAVLAQRLAAR